MSDQDRVFQQRWEFRRNQDDPDSSSDDQSGPKKHKLVSSFSSRGDNKEANDNTNADPRSEARLSSEETNKEPNPPRTNLNLRKKGKGKMQNPERSISSDQDNPFDAALNDLRGYAALLMEGIKVAREGMLDWMSKEIEKSDPNVKGRGKTDKPARNNPARSKRKSGTTNRKHDSGSSETVKGKTTSDPADDRVIKTPVKTKNWKTITTPSPSMEKKKRKRVSLSEKKQPQKTGATSDADQQSNKATVPATSVSVAQVSSYSTLPSVLEKQRADNQQKDGAYDHHGQSRGLGNGNRNGFPFPFTRGMNGGIGVLNTNQFGVQFLNQEDRMNGELVRLPSRNNTFLQNYGPLDQHLRFQVQSGVMDLQSYSDMRRANIQPR